MKIVHLYCESHIGNMKRLENSRKSFKIFQELKDPNFHDYRTLLIGKIIAFGMLNTTMQSQ